MADHAAPAAMNSRLEVEPPFAIGTVKSRSRSRSEAGTDVSSINAKKTLPPLCETPMAPAWSKLTRSPKGHTVAHRLDEIPRSSPLLR